MYLKKKQKQENKKATHTHRIQQLYVIRNESAGWGSVTWALAVWFNVSNSEKQYTVSRKWVEMTEEEVKSKTGAADG